MVNLFTMEVAAPHFSKVQHVASLIEQDVRRRGLSAGEPYLTAQQAGENLGIPRRTASRAMGLLAKRGLLVRKRGVGTFVGPELQRHQGPELKCVHVLAGSDAENSDVPFGELLEGLLDARAGREVQFNLLPRHHPAAYVRELIRKGAGDGSLSGLVLVQCPRVIRELVLASNVPAMVFGNRYQNTGKLPSIEVDQLEFGRLQAQYLLDQGHRRIAFLNHETWLPGDNLLVDGLNQVLAEARLSHGALVIRSIPVEHSVAMEEIRRLLSMEDGPTGLVCRGRLFADAAVAVVELLGLAVPEDIGVIFDHHVTKSLARPCLPHVRAELEYYPQAVMVGHMLRELVDGKRPEPEHVVLPAVLVEPAGSAAGEGRKNRSPAAGGGRARADRAESPPAPKPRDTGRTVRIGHAHR